MAKNLAYVMNDPYYDMSRNTSLLCIKVKGLTTHKGSFPIVEIRYLALTNAV